MVNYNDWKIYSYLRNNKGSNYTIYELEEALGIEYVVVQARCSELIKTTLVLVNSGKDRRKCTVKKNKNVMSTYAVCESTTDKDYFDAIIAERKLGDLKGRPAKKLLKECLFLIHTSGDYKFKRREALETKIEELNKLLRSQMKEQKTKVERNLKI